jgi:osmotically-inducible protein OsmY
MKSRRLTAILCVAVLLFVAAPALRAQMSDTQLQSQAQRALQGNRFRDVHVATSNGVVTLSGTVEYFSDKVNAQKKAQKADPKAMITNDIEVRWAGISDAELGEKLNMEIQRSRIGYGTTAFNAITVSIENGAVTLGGYAYGPVDASTAYNIAANTRGVKDVTNNIHVNPPSPQDNRIRRLEYRAIYGAPQLNRYAMDPVKPIRIQVDSGHVILFGTVDSQSDKDVAGIRAKGVSGVFSVENNLQVAEQER